MAKVNGVEIKSLKAFTGHDGATCFQGNVYLDGKKLGFWSQDAWCGPDDFSFSVKEIEKACMDFQAGFPEEHRYHEVLNDPDVFMGALVNLQLAEKDVKKGFREGYPAAIYVTDGFHVAWVHVPKDGADEELLKEYSKDVDSLKQHMFKGEEPKIMVFRPGLADLVIDKDHPAPAFFG